MSSEAIKKENMFTVKEMVFTAMFAVIIAVCSWISIPTTVPFTLQTFAVFACISMLGGKRSFFAVLVYIILGAVGIPVFAGFSGGIGVLFGSTGGYIIGFLLTALVCWIAERFFGEKLVVSIIAMVIGLILCYAFGTAWFMFIYGRNTGEIGLATALGWCVVPFIIPDIIKMVLAIVISKRVRKYVSL
jgi:biotin transport system substrate-specific component